jgi:hypothetical protein
MPAPAPTELLAEDVRRLEDSNQRIAVRMDGLESAIRDLGRDLGNWRAEVNREIGGLRSQIAGEIGELRSEIGGLRSQVAGEIGELRTPVAESLGRLMPTWRDFGAGPRHRWRWRGGVSAS